MKGPMVVTWCWGDFKFKAASRKLRLESMQQGLDVHVDEPDLKPYLQERPETVSRRMWVYRYIPRLLLRLSAFPRDLLYLHADMQFRGGLPPGVFEGIDVGFESAWSLDPPRPESILAAPIFLRKGEPALRFLRLWDSFCRNLHDDRSEHHHLHGAWRYMRDHDETCRFGIFDPPIASIKADAGTPIRGHK